MPLTQQERLALSAQHKLDAEQRKQEAEQLKFDAMQLKFAKLKEKYDDEAEQKEQARAEALRERQVVRAEQLKDRERGPALTTYVANGGSPEAFDDVWDDMYDRLVEARTLAQLVSPKKKPSFVL